MHRAGKLGLGSAYRAGFRVGLERGFEILCEMDADGSHDPVALRAMLAEIGRGADLVIGSRRVPGGGVVGWGPHRHLMSGGAMFLARLALGLKTRDVTSGYRCYRAPVVAALLKMPIRSSGYAFQEEAVFYAEKLGFKVRETPISFRDRLLGRSKLGWREVLQFFTVIVQLRREGSRLRREMKK